MSLVDELKRDKKCVSMAMAELPEESDCWQDRLLYALCKTAMDCLEWIFSKEASES